MHQDEGKFEICMTYLTHHSLPELLADLQAGGPGSGCRGSNCGRPRGVKQTFQTASGVNYTIYKPSRKGIAKGSHKWSAKKDQFKNKYQAYRAPGAAKSMTQVANLGGKKKGVSSVYDAAWGRGDVYEGHGKTIFVHRDFENMRVIVDEVPHDEMNHSATVRRFRFKNFGQAAGFLNKRYGIRMKLPK